MANQWGAGNKEKTGEVFQKTKVGDTDIGLFFGEHPHARSDSNIYARLPDGSVQGFSGHRLLWRVEIKEYNYFKESQYSGAEIRPGCTIMIFVNDDQIYETFHRNIESSLLEAHNLIRQLKDCCVDFWTKEDRQKLIGRKVFWRSTPAIVRSVITDQGCVILVPDGISEFPSPPWREDDDENDSVKAEILDNNIWWFRD